MRTGLLFVPATLILAALATPSGAQTSKTTVETKTEVKKDDDKKPVVVLDTSMGKITVELDREKAPLTVENFLKYVDDGYYENLVFHRVIPDFMIQGGGMEEVNGKLKEKKATYPAIKNESKTGLSNVRGTIAMARQDPPNSATCQFFINHDDNSNLDDYRGGYTAFGKVTDGMDVVDAIAKTKTDLSERGRGGAPLTPVVIKSVKRKSKS